MANKNQKRVARAARKERVRERWMRYLNKNGAETHKNTIRSK